MRDKEKLSTRIFSLLTVIITLLPFVQYLAQGVTVVAEEAAKAKTIELFKLPAGTATAAYQRTEDGKIDWTIQLTKTTTTTSQVGFQLTAGTEKIEPTAVKTTPANLFSYQKETHALVENVASQVPEQVALTFTIPAKDAVTFTSSWNETQGDGTVKNLLAAAKPVTIDTKAAKVATSATTSTTSTATNDSTTTATAAKSVEESTVSTVSPSTTESTTTTSDSTTTTEEITDNAVKLLSPPTKSAKNITSYGVETIFSDVVILDKDGNPLLKDTTISDGQDISLEYTWDIPEEIRTQIHAGDYFDFDLPAQFKVQVEKGQLLSGQLKDAQGTVFGNFTITEDGKVHIVFEKAIEDHSDVHGDFYISGQAVKGENDNPGNNDLTIPFVDNDEIEIPKINIPKEKVLKKEVSGQTSPADEQNQGTITWKITVNEAKLKLNGASLKDALPQGITFTKLAKVEKNGVEVPVSDYGYVKSEQPDLVLSVPDGNDTYTFYLETNVNFNDQSLVSDPTKEIVNQATLSQNGWDDLTVDAATRFGYESKLEKTAGSNQEIKNGIAPWHLKFTKTGVNLPAGTTFTETMTNGQVFAKEDGTELTKEDEIGEYLSAQSGLNIKVEITDTAGQYKLIFPDGVSSDFDFTYYTKIAAEFGTEYKNTIDWNDQHPGGSYTLKKHQFTKTGGEVKDGKINWTVNFTVNDEPLAKDTTITDTMDRNQVLLDDSGNELVFENGKATFSESPKIEIEKGTTDADGKTTYTWHFLDEVTNDFTINYQTSTPDSNLSSGAFTNTLNGDGIDGNGIGHVTTNQPSFDKERLHFDNLNETKELAGQAQWQLIANPEHYAIEGWSFADTLTGSSFGKDDTITVYALDAGETADDLTKAEKLVKDTDYTLTETEDAKSFTIQSKDNSKTTQEIVVVYTSSYQVKADEYDHKVHNSATFTYNLGNNPQTDTKGTNDFNPHEDLRKEIGGSKEGAYDLANKQVNWKIVVNNGQVALGENGILTDPIPAGVTYDEAKANFTSTTLDEQGAEIAGKLTAELVEAGATKTFFGEEVNGGDNGVLVVTGFAKDSTAPYTITFSTQLKETTTLPTGKVTNTATYHDDNVKPKDLTGTADYTKVDSYISKTANVASGTEKNDGDTVDYTIEVNKDKLPLQNVKLVDERTNLNVIKESLAVYEVTDEGNEEKVAASRYYVSFQEQQMVIYLSDEDVVMGADGKVDTSVMRPITKHYRISYQGTVIYNKENAKATNKVTITGDNVDKSIPSKDVDIKIKTPVTGGNTEWTTGSLTFKKVDASNHGKVLAGAVFTLYRGAVSENTIVASDKVTDNVGLVTFNNLTYGTYVLQEDTAPVGYAKANKTWTFEVTKDKVAATYEVENTPTGALKLIKEDTNGRPLKGAVFQLLQNDTDEIVTTDANGKNLPAEYTTNENGEISVDNLLPGKYKWHEVSAPTGYLITNANPTVEVGSGEETATTVKNVEATALSGDKIWDDLLEDTHGLIPDQVTLNLQSRIADSKDEWQNVTNEEGAAVTTEVTADNWHYEFSDLPLYDKDNNKLEYRVTDDIPGFTPKVTDKTNLLNKLKTTQIHVKKVWDDVNNYYQTRPDELKATLMVKNGDDWQTFFDAFGLEKTATLTKTSDQNIWVADFDNLPIYDAAGNEITYAVKEELSNGNTYTTTPDGQVVANGENAELQNNLAKTQITVTKDWVDFDDHFNLRPSQITFELSATNEAGVTTSVTTPDNPSGEFTLQAADYTKGYTITDLPAYDKEGSKLTYTVTETNIKKNYQQTPAYKVEDGTLNITNTLITTEVSGEKEWSDFDNQFTSRPEKVTVQLYQNGNKVEGYELQTTANNNWSYTFRNLPKVDEEGKDYIYTVKEVNVPANYTAAAEDMNVTNTLVTTEVSGEKSWIDFDNQFNSRPANVTVQLYQNGDKLDGFTADTTAAANWQYTFTDLPKLDAEGQEYVYTVEEVDVPANYTAVAKDMNVTNTLITTEISGTKTWNDQDDQDGLRPTKITVTLYQNGTAFQTQEVAAKDNWQYTFSNLPKLAPNGEAYVYTIGEANVPDGYTVAVAGYDLTNTHTPETPPTPPRPGLPRTGLPQTSDTIQSGLSILGALVLVAVALWFWRRRQAK